MHNQTLPWYHSNSLPSFNDKEKHSWDALTDIKPTNPTYRNSEIALQSFRLAAPGRHSVLGTWEDLSACESSSLASPIDLLFPFNAFFYSVVIIYQISFLRYVVLRFINASY